MKSTEFTNEGVDRSVDDVKANHPEIYDFFKKTGSWMTFDRQTRKVDSYDTDNSHMVQITMGPSAGMGNTEANIKSAGISYESITNPMGGGQVLSGNIGEMYWSVKDDNRRGNITETWLFTFPRTDIEEERDYGDDQATNKTLDQLIRKSGYRSQRSYHFPRQEKQEELVSRLESLINGAGYSRSKSANGGEYAYEYNVDGRTIVFNYRDADTGLSGWYGMDNNVEEPIDEGEPVDEGDVVKGDFGQKGGPKPQMQNAKKLDLSTVFGSDAANVLRQEGIKFYEKPSYWSDLARKAMNTDTLRTADFALSEEGIDLPEYAAWEIYSINPDSSSAYIKGPLQTVENMPDAKVFVIYDLPYSDERRGVEEPQIGTFLVDTQGAKSYIRSWIMIK